MNKTKKIAKQVDWKFGLLVIGLILLGIIVTNLNQRVDLQTQAAGKATSPAKR